MSSSNRNDDGTYGPVKRSDDSEVYYRPQSYHNRTAANRKDKEKWCIRENEQYDVFYFAAEDKISPIWYCDDNKSLFSIVDDGKKILGCNDERIAKFKEPQNTSDPWHGYPVESKEKYNSPSDELLDLWEENSIISRITRRRIERSKI